MKEKPEDGYSAGWDPEITGPEQEEGVARIAKRKERHNQQKIFKSFVPPFPMEFEGGRL